MACAKMRRDDDGGEPSAAGVGLTSSAGDDVSADLDDGAAAGGVDLTGRLSDDVLVRVLELVPDARDLVRTGAVSHRWRGLWTRVPSLRFASSARPEFTSPATGGGSGAERYAAIVTDTLALRAAETEPAVEHLAISFNQQKCGNKAKELAALAAPSIIGAAQAWVHHAVEHGIKSLDLEVRLPTSFSPRRPPMALNKVPSSAALETLHLDIGDAMVQLPATAVFASLKDLSLERMAVSIDGGHALTCLLSPVCCPRLKKLRMRKLRIQHAGIHNLSIEAGELSELSLENMEDPLALELRTPSLHVLRIICSSLEQLAIYSAPSLEVITVLDELPYRMDVVSGQLPCLRTLGVVPLRSHSCSYDFEAEMINDAAIHALQCCTSLRRLHVSLDVPKKTEQVSDIINNRIPNLPSVTRLIVKTFLSELHSSRDGLSEILTRCNNLKYLCLDIKYHIDTQKIPGLELTCHHEDYCKSHEISLAHLKEVEFKGLSGTDCELWLMQSVISSAKDVQKLAVSFNTKYRPKDRREAFDLTSLVGDGVWTDCHGVCLSYEWRPYL